MKVAYYDKKMETLDRDKLEKLQLKRLRATVDKALEIEFYHKRLSKIGILSGNDICSLSDIKMIPYTTKEDLQSGYPESFLAVPGDKVVRLHTSSGTMGTSTVIYHTAGDIDSWSALTARSMFAAGARNIDVFQNINAYGLFTGGLGMHYGAELLGMTVIPSGAGHSIKQIHLMRDFKTTIVHATPGYLLHLYGLMQDLMISPAELSLRKAFLGAEPYCENTRDKIEKLLQIEAYNSYGLTEMNGPGVAFECMERNGMHVWEDAYFMETIDPDTLKSVEDGQEGELVFTTLTREATPLLRYRTRDLASIYTDSCECGRTHRRISRIKGRTDDMFIINGINVYPSQIEAVIMKHSEVGTNYRVYIEKKGALDKVIIRIELFKGAVEKYTQDELDRLKQRLTKELTDAIIVNPTIEFWEAGSLPSYGSKALRVIDDRNELLW